ncbi:MAG: ABC transporter substrate-binding protein [Pseudonocardia sp.]|uniref:ABC transporter substrate-binding protein n=1 Tax=Pseudonocardia sp. TaxID=60912 RepID=UPI001AD33977|nr:ABC transporter substrate-binding protein [Pseudonocardia sp.]MBN9098901.1 ABC transporter substrate-binding protein [Pseudonocardia sp.]
MRPRLLSSIAVVATAAVVLAGCGAGGDGSGDGSGSGSGSGGASASSTAIPVPAKDDALAAMVPASVSADGKIVVGTDASYAPNEFTAPDGTTVIGMDVDLGTAVAEKLGLKAEFQNSNFDGIIPGITGKRYELGMSSFTINDERVKSVDMVSYFSAGTSLAVAKGNPDGITGADALCGKAVGVQTGTVQAEDIVKRNTACTAAGKPAIAVTQLQAQSDVTLALASKRIVAMLADSPVVAYAVTTTEGALEVVGTPYDTAPYGIVLAKNQGDYAKAVQGAVQALIGDGTYAAILKKWNVDAGAIPTSEVKS